ncbi:formate dehydrogenase accessory sulfurtransferase FdhD [Microbacterium gilvum]|uniref:Sulfur carrier protein FdhD n=1 Tax=Microbacterium gilvum TaxID=1336204 RepID=A0ABP8ZUZ6_9MICO
MGRITARRPVVRIRMDGPDGPASSRRPDALAVEEPLEIRIGGAALTVTMRTPGHDVELATGFLVSEGVVRRADDVRAAIHCGGPGTGGEENTYNVLDLSLAHAVDVAPLVRAFPTTSACGVCGTASIAQVQARAPFDVAADPVRIPAALLAGIPDRLRARQDVFAQTGGLHAAALVEVGTGDIVVVREDVGRHNAVDKVVGWAAARGLLPLAGHVLAVSGRASFELVQKAAMAGIPALAAVSAPSSLAVELAADRGITLVGFLRGATMNAYAGAERIVVSGPAAAGPA